MRICYTRVQWYEPRPALSAAGKTHAGIASGVNNAVARVAGLPAVAALGAAFYAIFLHHLGEMTPVRENEALYDVMSGQPDTSAEAVAAFGQALRAMMLVPASSAALPASLAGCGSNRPLRV